MSKRKPKRTRKSTNGCRYIQKYGEWLESPAYRDLTPLARTLLEEFLIIYRPGRNGILSIDTRRAAKRLNVSKNTVKRPFYDLVERGFITLTKGELWQEKLAREWRLTVEPHNGREPTDDWKYWSPKNKTRPQELRHPAHNIKPSLAEICRQAKIYN